MWPRQSIKMLCRRCFCSSWSYWFVIEFWIKTFINLINYYYFYLDLGDKRHVFSDPNFPLEGDHNAMGRSIVLFGPNFSGERFACANIEPDHYIVKYINLQKPPKFVV